ncbi:MAG: 2-C-methyl-D-erythritol 4-phosphate cytidylyltransferase [Chloroflexota bacterium]|nr:2-C-methyl-D-erythritol 4-phosphate cytidylyltransferase [Chloroflexota bacterium]
MTDYAVVLAAGRGERMGGERNKALLPLGGRPLLLHSVETMRRCVGQVMVVAGAAGLTEVRALLPDCEVILGGATRQESEWRALSALRSRVAAGDVIALHDAARPLVVAADVRAVFREAAATGAAMLARAAALPLLALTAGPDRTSEGHPAGAAVVAGTYQPRSIWCAETPQAARAEMLLDAYERAMRDGFLGTDTAAVLVRCGYRVRILASTGANPKITVPSDVQLAERLLAERAGAGSLEPPAKGTDTAQ